MNEEEWCHKEDRIKDEKAENDSTGMFAKDSFVLDRKGDWALIVYADRCVSLLSKDGSEIKSLSCCASENEDLSVSDEAYLLDRIGELYMLKVKQCERLLSQLQLYNLK